MPRPMELRIYVMKCCVCGRTDRREVPINADPDKAFEDWVDGYRNQPMCPTCDKENQ